MVQQHAALCDGLEHAGLQQERRALRIKLSDLQMEQVEASTLRLSFGLPASAYATVVLAQLGQFQDASSEAA